MPGGKIDLNETEQQALHREVKEELSVDLLSDSIKHYGVFEAPAVNLILKKLHQDKFIY